MRKCELMFALPQTLSLMAGFCFQTNELLASGERKSPVSVSVALANEGRVEVFAVEGDIAQQQPVAVAAVCDGNLGPSGRSCLQAAGGVKWAASRPKCSTGAGGMLGFGSIDAQEPHRQADQQTNQVLCLNLVTNAIVTWNTVYMNAAIERLRAEGRIGRDIDLGHLSPALYGHVNPYGKYRFEIEGRAPSLRPLRSPGNDA